MARATLVGFSNFLDWKCLVFQGPLPRAWICDVCGLLSQTSMVTGCLHAFCLDCYEAIQGEAGPKCPLDATVIVPSETKEFVLGDEKKKKLVVRCLNAEHGCGFEGPLFDLETHFVNDCNFHAVSCKACRVPVLRKKILEHSKACDFEATYREKCGIECNGLKPNVASGGNRCLEAYAPTADAGRCACDDKVNVLAESMKKCSLSVNGLVDLAKSVVESMERCITATDDSASKMVTVVESVEDCTETVKEVQAICKYIPNSWLAACLQPNYLGNRQHVFVCRDFSAKVAAAPATDADGCHHYPAWCPQGEKTVNGYQVQLSQTIYTSKAKKTFVTFKLLFAGKAQTAGLSIDITLVMVHPTQANLNKRRPLMSNELFVTTDHVKNFWFSANSLLEKGFVADDMLLLCLETSG